MDLLARIIKEERKLEKRLLELQQELERARAASRALGGSRRMSAGGRRKISRAAKRRWREFRRRQKAA
jgi:hypothetical protein